MTNYYTGIGARKTPSDVLDTMTTIANFLQMHYYTLRSGAAQGADSAFEAGASGHADVMLPWKGFNAHTSTLYVPDLYMSTSQRYGKLLRRAAKTAEHIHPAWDRLSDSSRRFHIRNVWQVLGVKMDRISDFVVCWTPGGEAVGGSATVINLAKQIGVDVYNLAVMSEDDVMGKLIDWIEKVQNG